MLSWASTQLPWHTDAWIDTHSHKNHSYWNKNLQTCWFGPAHNYLDTQTHEWTPTCTRTTAIEIKTYDRADMPTSHPHTLRSVSLSSFDPTDISSSTWSSALFALSCSSNSSMSCESTASRVWIWRQSMCGEHMDMCLLCKCFCAFVWTCACKVNFCVCLVCITYEEIQ